MCCYVTLYIYLFKLWFNFGSLSHHFYQPSKFLSHQNDWVKKKLHYYKKSMWSEETRVEMITSKTRSCEK